MRASILRKIIPAAAFACFAAFAFAQPNDGHPDKGIFDLLNTKEEVEITLLTDMDSLLQKKKTSDYIAGTFKIKLGKKDERSLPVKIRSRGKFRRMKCSFPPLKLKFKKDDLAAQGLNGFNELKLVTHCVDEKITSRELILREYLIYKLYNELTPNSFRVQLVKVNYECTATGEKFKRSGILLEDSDELAQRIGGKLVQRMGLLPDSLHTMQEKISSLFEYMVSNHDWSYLLNRNIEFIKMPDGKFLPVPYDFDFSGVVSAPYARADAKLGQKNMRDRFFIGNAKSVAELQPAISYFLTKKEDLMSIVDNFDLLDEPSRLDIHAYLETFFQIIDDKKQMEQVMFLKKE